MQTFITSYDFEEVANTLDNKRLFKQIVEGNQILKCLLVTESRRKNHPAIKMWKGHEYILCQYINALIKVWKSKGYKCPKSEASLSKFMILVKKNDKFPEWINDDFIYAHKSNLIRKKPEYYKEKFGNDIPNNLPYIWPVS